MKHTTFRMILGREKKPSENSCLPQSSGGNRENSPGFSNACCVVWLFLPEGKAEAWPLTHTKPGLWLQCCSPSAVHSGPFPVGPDAPCPFCSKSNRRDTSTRVYYGSQSSVSVLCSPSLAAETELLHNGRTDMWTDV